MRLKKSKKATSVTGGSAVVYFAFVGWRNVAVTLNDQWSKREIADVDN